MRKRIKNFCLISLFILIGLASFLLFLKYYLRKSFEERKIENFIRDNLKKEYQPSFLKVQQGLAVTGALGGSSTLYAAVWEKEGKKFWAGLHYNEAKTVINDIHLIIDPGEKLENLNEDIAQSIAKTYFKNFKEENWKCEVLENNTIFCESFWLNKKTKNKLGIIIIRYPNLDFGIGLCIHPIKSEFYDWKSCAEQKK
jgi:hypothetical protein